MQAVLEMGPLERISFSMELFTSLGPISWSARRDVEKTNKTRNPKPSTDARNQFLSFGWFFAWKKLNKLYWGLAMHLSSQKNAVSSSVWIPTNDNACTQSVDQESADAIRGQPQLTLQNSAVHENWTSKKPMCSIHSHCPTEYTIPKLRSPRILEMFLPVWCKNTYWYIIYH